MLRNWESSNKCLGFHKFRKKLHHIYTIVEKEDTNKKQDDTEDVHTRDVVAAIEEFKGPDPEIDNKSLNIKDVAIEPDQAMSETIYASDDLFEENTGGDIMKVKVSDQSSIIL